MIEESNAMPKTVYRIDQELRGKELSANTIASFLIAQETKSAADLCAKKDMSRVLLEFLNRERAMRFWADNRWLQLEGAVCRLTDAGLDEVLSREAGVAYGRTGKKKPSNVSPMKVAVALKIIETGQSSDYEKIIGKSFQTLSG
jgi:hypothetical protein